MRAHVCAHTRPSWWIFWWTFQKRDIHTHRQTDRQTNTQTSQPIELLAAAKNVRRSLKVVYVICYRNVRKIHEIKREFWGTSWEFQGLGPPPLYSPSHSATFRENLGRASPVGDTLPESHPERMRFFFLKNF